MEVMLCNARSLTGCVELLSGSLSGSTAGYGAFQTHGGVLRMGPDVLLQNNWLGEIEIEMDTPVRTLAWTQGAGCWAD